MLKKTRGVIVGLILGIILSGTVAFAANGTTLYNVLNSGIRIVIDGQELYPVDVNGNKVEPMIYNGTTYLPVRAVASALGKAVYWDGPNYTVYLGNMNGNLEYPTAYLKDMKSISSSSVHTTSYRTDNYGTTYDNAVSLRDWEFLLNYKYSHFKGTLYVIDGTYTDSKCYMTVTADGKVIYTSPEMNKTSRPLDFDINISGYNDVKIQFVSEWSSAGYTRLSSEMAIANGGFYQ